jgi:hypothetical protein
VSGCACIHIRMVVQVLVARTFADPAVAPVLAAHRLIEHIFTQRARFRADMRAVHQSVRGPLGTEGAVGKHRLAQVSKLVVSARGIHGPFTPATAAQGFPARQRTRASDRQSRRWVVWLSATTKGKNILHEGKRRRVHARAAALKTLNSEELTLLSEAAALIDRVVATPDERHAPRRFMTS